MSEKLPQQSTLHSWLGSKNASSSAPFTPLPSDVPKKHSRPRKLVNFEIQTEESMKVMMTFKLLKILTKSPMANWIQTLNCILNLNLKMDLMTQNSLLIQNN
ncbi:hypothetical protein HK096_002841 [Nowakowskiella sp. JEL0078]|nr:hypothetical protein HK096_002841 [Nowakowskiella sp. JEL0078]